MKARVPVYIEQDVERTFFLRPLFFEGPEQRDGDLRRATSRFKQQAQRHLEGLARNASHEGLAGALFCPETEDRQLKLHLSRRKGPSTLSLLFVRFRSGNRTIAMAPRFRDLWFTIEPGESFHARASEVVQRHIRHMERQLQGGEVDLADFPQEGRAWTTTLDVDFSCPSRHRGRADTRLQAVGETDPVDGLTELRRVGRCLDDLYPDGLRRAVERDHEVSELERVLGARDPRPVVLLGEAMSGKTTILHECVRRACEGRKRARGQPQAPNDALKRRFWLIAPQRVISGMQYLGQWEARLLAILKLASRRRHVLCFDDFLGLYQVGSAGDMTLAHVLKPYVERSEVAIVAEMTPRAFHLLQERDRGFADLFHVIHVHEMTERQAARVLIRARLEIEEEFHCEIYPFELTSAMDVCRRYIRHLALPGKAVQLLRRAAARGHHPLRVLAESTGVHPELVSDYLEWVLASESMEFSPGHMLRRLQQLDMAQAEAVQAVTEVVLIAKAGLADPRRPLGTFLFLGPTGVGKTRCAKGLADIVFRGRLLRFDMNEHADTHAVDRLVGTTARPDGTLTAAARENPFAVLLLDEIEKAHPAVWDLLLQLLEDARLTDAAGRTTDFSNTIVIMTSNVGARESAGAIGFAGTEPPSVRSVYLRAAEERFSPEFFNRIDRIVPFASIGRNDMESIANIHIWKMLERPGLSRRSLMVDIHPLVKTRIVDDGYHPQLGARALKRSIERQLVRPLAERLLESTSPAPALVRFLMQGNTIGLDVQVLREAEPRPSAVGGIDCSRPREMLERMDAALDRIEEHLQRFAPVGPLRSGSIREEHYHYFTLRDGFARVRSRVRGALDAVDRRGPRGRIRVRTARKGWLRTLQWWARGVGGSVLAELCSAADVQDFLADLGTQAASEEDPNSFLPELAGEVSYLNLLASQAIERLAERALVHLRLVPPSRWLAIDDRLTVLDSLRSVYVEGFGFDATSWAENDEPCLLVEGLGAPVITALDAGTHLFYWGYEHPDAVRFTAQRIEPGEEPARLVRASLDKEAKWIEALAKGVARLEDDPSHLDPVVRVYSNLFSPKSSTTLDLRTGKIVPSSPPPPNVHRALILSQLPAPPELLDADHP